MHRMMVLYPFPDDPKHFLEYYASKHVPMAKDLPGIRRYSYGQPAVLGPGQSPYFLVFEADFDDAAAMQTALTSDAGKKVGGDVKNYSPKGATMLHFEVTSS